MDKTRPSANDMFTRHARAAESLSVHLTEGWGWGGVRVLGSGTLGFGVARVASGGERAFRRFRGFGLGF